MTGDEKYLGESWQAMGDIEEMQYQDFKSKYEFEEKNEFLNEQNPLEKLKEHLLKGNLLNVSLII